MEKKTASVISICIMPNLSAVLGGPHDFCSGGVFVVSVRVWRACWVILTLVF